MLTKKEIFLFLMPFFGFVITYIVWSEIIYRKKIVIPYLIGKTFEKTLEELYKKNIIFKIRSISYTKEIQPNVILNQYPKGGTIAQKSKPLLFDILLYSSPEIISVIGIEEKNATYILESRGFKVNKIQINISYPKGIVYAESYIKKNNQYTLFIANSEEKKFLIPSFISLFCKDIGLKEDKYKCYNAETNEPWINQNNHPNIIKQSPIAGTFIDINTKISFWH